MSGDPRISRRRFLKRTFAFSASATLAAQVGCGWEILKPGYQEEFSAPAPANVLMVGDWGVEGDRTEQRSVANAMASFVQKHTISPDALLMLGDNFYGSMHEGADSARWQTQFEEMYPRTVFDCPAYAVLGNHDYQYAPGLKCDYELAYAARGTSRFTLPFNWYRFMLPAQNPSLTILALDSNGPRMSIEGSSYTSMTEEMWDRQTAWLEAELEKPLMTPFLAVMAHHPVYSNGMWGDSRRLIESWKPLFSKHKVHLYMAGHDHDLQHLEIENCPTSFFLSGGGGGPLSPLKVDDAKRGPFAQQAFGFSHLHCTPELMTLRHLNRMGSLMHKFTKDPHGNVTILYSAPPQE